MSDLIGWLIATFTGATGTLTLRTVLHNMVHIVWVLTVVIFCSGIMMLLGLLFTLFVSNDAKGLLPGRRKAFSLRSATAA